MDFSRRSFYHPRTSDHDNIATLHNNNRRRYNNNNFYRDDKNCCGEEEYIIKLLIRRASNIVLLKGTFPYSLDGIYRVIVSDESGREFSTNRRIGRPAPVWDEDIEIRFSSYPFGQILKLMVIRENCYDDPGTSTGEVVVGRATIPVPMKVERKKDQVIELVKLVGVEKRTEALISFQISLKTIKRRRYYID